MAWTIVATNSTIWSSGSTSSGGEYHPLGSPIGLLLVLTYPEAGDVRWNQGYNTPTVWTQI